jgi:uncharacterized membrane protein YagU involved in acid resistance
MLPHSHFIVSALAIFTLSLPFLPVGASELAGWIIVGGLVSALIDLDVVALVYWRSRSDSDLKPFTNPVELYKNYERFLDVIGEREILRTAFKTHFLISILFILLFYLFSPRYFIPVAIGVVTHVLSDLPSLQKFRMS